MHPVEDAINGEVIVLLLDDCPRKEAQNIVTYCSEAEPLLWGSRVVGTARGPSPLMHFRLPKRPIMTVLWKNRYSSAITVKHGACYAGEEGVLGSPCQMDGESANITLNDVSKEDALQVWGKDGLFSTTFFVPNCVFRKPNAGDVDLKTSFPLSRFEKGKSHVQLKFAVGGANNQSLVILRENGARRCTWRGIKIVGYAAPICSDLAIDTSADLRIFALNFARRGIRKNTSFEWIGLRNRLIVTVDWGQKGESPELATCRDHRGKIKPRMLSLRAVNSPTTSPPTPSSGPTNTLVVNALSAPLLIPRLL
ncbi:hypothetical protein TcWFU_009273 [Taenia crassiceps]|uniref:DUF5727 domain-containing protein n=1 Tax=Taenia crassiceps TaxID=6207 RepID=A0ABR4Q350_9CEST